MSTVERLERDWRELGRRRRRQIRLFDATKLRGHARRAADLGYRMRHKRKRIEGIEAARKANQPTWKMEWVARFVAPWEGLRTTAYQDSGGVWTIGHGHTGKHAYPGNTISKAFALVLLASDLREAGRCVAQSVNVPLTIRERIACISLAFNIGCGGFNSSTFLEKLNEGKRLEAADALMMWVRDDNGDILLGLQRRRRAERWLFYHPKKGITRS